MMNNRKLRFFTVAAATGAHHSVKVRILPVYLYVPVEIDKGNNSNSNFSDFFYIERVS